MMRVRDSQQKGAFLDRKDFSTYSRCSGLRGVLLKFREKRLTARRVTLAKSALKVWSQETCIGSSLDGCRRKGVVDLEKKVARSTSSSPVFGGGIVRNHAYERREWLVPPRQMQTMKREGSPIADERL